MADFNEDEIDKGFRRVIEGKSVEPPASLWANIRISALERQLIRYQSMTFWFKGAVGVLAGLLGGTGYFLYQAKSALPLVQKEVVTITKTDTVYLTKSEKVFVDRPVVVYAENLNAKMNEINPDFNKNEQNDETGTSDNTLTKDGKRDLNNEPITQNGLTANPSSKQNSQKTIKNSKLITNRVKNSNARYSEQNNSTKNQVDKIKNNAFFPQETPISSQESIKDGKLTEGSPIEDLTIDFLEPLPMELNPQLSIPQIKYHSTFKTAIKLPKVRIPFIDRLSLSSYVSPEWNSVDVRRDEPNAFKYGDEELQAGVIAGLRAGVRLSEKWSVLTGVEFSGTSFDDRNRRQTLSAEAINGRFGYLYRTALGTVEIPAENFFTPSQSGSVVGLEVHEPIQRYVLGVPLLVRYDVWGNQFRFLNQVPMKIQFYGLLGGYWQIPLGQEGKVEIFENSGREFTSEITKFQNLSNSYGVNLGVGAELGIGKHFNLFVEPSYSQGISSVVRDMPIRSVISSFGLKMGAKWRFGKQ